MESTQNSTQQILEALNKGFEDLKNGFKTMQNDITFLKKDVSGLKSDMSGVKEDVSGLKSDNKSIRASLKELKKEDNLILKSIHDFSEDMQENFNGVNLRLDNLEIGNIRTHLRLDNVAHRFELEDLERKVAKIKK